MNHRNTDVREAALSEEAKTRICEELKNEECAEGTKINWSAEVIWNFGSKLPVQMASLTAAFMHCYITGRLLGVDPSKLKVSEEDARMALGASCYEAFDKTLEKLCGGKVDD